MRSRFLYALILVAFVSASLTHAQDANNAGAKSAGKIVPMKLSADQIPAAERYPWQPKELVAVIGSHSFRHWDSIDWRVL